MKIIKVPFEALLWSCHDIQSPKVLLKTIFIHEFLENLKAQLAAMAAQTYTQEIYQSESPENVFREYAMFRSIIRVSYFLHLNKNEFTLKKEADDVEALGCGFLSRAEYIDPFSAFDDVFSDMALEKIDYALFEITTYAVNRFNDIPDYDLITPFIKLNKLLDACWLINKRKLKRKRDNS